MGIEWGDDTLDDDRPAEPVMTFGKYKGLTVGHVIKAYPDYVLWAHRNVSFFKLTTSQIQDCVSRSVAGSRGILPGSPIDDDCGDDSYGGMSYADFGNN